MQILARIQKRLKKSLLWTRGWWMVHVILPVHRILRIPLRDLNAYERRVPFIERREFAQNGEDGLLEAIFGMIGVTNKYFVEFGVEDGIQCNTRHLMVHKGWKGLLMDGGDHGPASPVKREFITAENIESLFEKYGVPRDFDLLSIDIDGNDYWVWKAITRYRPRVVIMEYNACIPASPAVTVPYRADFQWDKTDYYGGSLEAMVKLGQSRGYTLVATDKNGVNAFFVLNDDAAKAFRPHPWSSLYHPAAFKGVPGNAHPHSAGREWVTV